MTIQVVLADDQPLVRAGLRMLIEQTPDIDVAGEAATGAEAVRLTTATDPDVVVMDIRMPGMNGIDATQQITAGDMRARVLMLTTFDDDDPFTPHCEPGPADSSSRTWPWTTS